jgi:outer membrane protein
MKPSLLINALIIAVVIALPFTGTKTEAAGPVKIGVIDAQKIMRESRAARIAQADFMKDMEGKRAQLLAKDKEIKALDEELKNPELRLTEQIRKEKAEKLAREVKEFRRMDADMAEDLKKKDMELTQKILADIRRIVQSFAKSEKYTLILERNAVVTADDAIDITGRILMLYDEGK